MNEAAAKSRRFLTDDPAPPEVYEVGREIIHGVLDRAKPQFEAQGKSLSYSEWILDYFRVSAGRERPDKENYFITFDRTVPWSLFSDISAFVDVAANRLGDQEYSEIFGDVLEPGQIGILPAGWDALECRDTIFERALVWLFHHELGHLFQDHERIRKENAPEGVDITLFVDEMMSKSEALASDMRLSWVYHATEFAADHQALHYSIFYADAKQSVASAKDISKGSIWCLVCAVAYMFHFFFSDRLYADVLEVAEGSHPDPTMRLAMLTGHLVQLLDWKSVRVNAPNAPSLEDAEKIVSSAEAAVGVYWALTHADADKALKLTDVLGRLLKCQDSILKYQIRLASVWNELRPEIMKTYFGENRAHVMDVAPPAGGPSVGI